MALQRLSQRSIALISIICRPVREILSLHLTIDAFSINLYTGAANFYKAGAEVSYVLKNGRPSKIENVSLPAGILGGAEYEQSSICLGAGDIAVLITDGVTAGGSDWIPSELRSLSEKTAEEIERAKNAKTGYPCKDHCHTGIK